MPDKMISDIPERPRGQGIPEEPEVEEEATEVQSDPEPEKKEEVGDA